MIPDDTSTFSYDGEGDPDTFSLSQLEVAVSSHFGTACDLHRMTEGGYHKIYDALRKDGTLLGIVRVAAPAFPKDKLESEVATLKYLATHTQIPVPEVYAWNSDASNPVGAEYMILQKMPGVSADKQWDVLSMRVKERIVAQVAEHLRTMFALRFDRAGSLYLSSPSQCEVEVGPIVSTPFFRALDGVVRIPDSERSVTDVSQFRGPFSSTTEYLQSFVQAELYVLSHHRSIVFAELDKGDEEATRGQLEVAECALGKALGLCCVYPGDYDPGGLICTPEKPFSLRLDDFRLSNIMIDPASATVTALIDFECTMIAPLWKCAIVPGWLLDPDDTEGTYEGGPVEDRRVLREIFCKVMDSEEWRGLYKYGKLFRHFCERLSLQASSWTSRSVTKWVDERLAWAKLHPGVALEKEPCASDCNLLSAEGQVA